MVQRLFRKAYKNRCLFIFLFFLFFIPLLSFGQQDSLKITFHLTSISDTTQFRDLIADFPNPVLSVISVFNEENQYVHDLANKDKWLGPEDISESGYKVDDIWDIILEYHEENPAFPQIQDVKMMTPEYRVTEIPEYSGTLLSIALAMDYSWSLRDDAYVIGDAAVDFVKQFDEKDRAAVIKFYEKVVFLQDFTSDKNLLIKAIQERLPERGGTALYQAAYKAVIECSDEPGKRVVVLYTDGEDVSGGVTVDQIIDAAKEGNVSIFTIGLGVRLMEDELKRMAKETGGFYTHAETAEEMADIYSKIYQTVKSQYVLAHTTTDHHTNGTWRIVDLKLKYEDIEGTGQGKYYVPMLRPSISITKKVETDSMVVYGSDTTHYATAGDTISYDLYILNQGSGVAYDVNVRDALPDSVTFVDSDFTPSMAGTDSIFWDIEEIPTNSTTKISYRVCIRPTMPMGATPLTNRVVIECAYDSILTDNQDEATFNAMGFPDFNVTCTQTGKILSPGYPAQLTAVVGNIGHSDNDQMFRVGFYIGTLASEPVGIDTIYSLEAGKTQQVQCIWEEPETGVQQLIVMADMDDAISELSETNNYDTCDVSVRIDSLGVQISGISYTNQLKGVQGQFPNSVISMVTVIDQNLNPIHELADTDVWLGISDQCELGTPVGNVWQEIREFYRDAPSTPSNPDVQPGIRVTEIVDSDLSVVFLVDFTSNLNSMGADLKTALEKFISRFNPTDQGAVIGIQNGVNLLQDFTFDSALLTSAVDKPFSYQSGMIYDGFYQAITLSKTRSGRSVVFAVIGEDNITNNYSLNDVIEHAQSSGVPLYVFGLNDHVGSNQLNQLCGKTGGYYYEGSDINAFENGLMVSEAQMCNYYGLVHFSSDTLQNNTWRALDLEIAAFEKTGRDTGYYRAPLGVADLSVEKAGVGDSSVVVNGDTTWWVHPGDSIFYAITVRNQGHFDMQNITIEDILPDYIIPESLCGDTIQWMIADLDIGRTAQFEYHCRVDTLMPPLNTAIVNRVKIICDTDVIPENNQFQDTVWAVAMISPDPEVHVSPEWIRPGDDIQVDVMSPVFAENWDLKIYFEDGTWDTAYADNFIQSTELQPNLWTAVVPTFGNTEKRTTQINEKVGVIFQTTDIWNVTKRDTAFFNIAVEDLLIDKHGTGDSLSVLNGDSIWYVHAGDSVRYTLTVQNIGHWNVDDILVEDILPDHLIPESICGDTLRWIVENLSSGEEVNFSYACRLDTMVPPWNIPLVNYAILGCDADTILENNDVLDTVWAIGLMTPYPQVRVSPTVINPKDSVQIEVMSPIQIEKDKWDLKIFFENKELISSYADDYIQSTVLYPSIWQTLTPKFDDTKMRTLNSQERVSVILETEDMWGVVKADTAYFKIRSINEFVLDDNYFQPDGGGDLAIRFRLSSNRKADIKIYDVAGYFVKNVENRFFEAGWNTTYWDGTNERGNIVGSGLYIVTISSGDMHEAKKVIVIR